MTSIKLAKHKSVSVSNLEAILLSPVLIACSSSTPPIVGHRGILAAVILHCRPGPPHITNCGPGVAVGGGGALDITWNQPVICKNNYTLLVGLDWKDAKI